MPVYDISGNEIYSQGGGGGSSSPISDIFMQTQLSAHKGGNATTANTIANFEAGISNGYKILEGDVRFTSDSVPVLSHDASVGGYTIASYTYDELVELVPTIARLDDFLLLCKKSNVVAELDFTKEYNQAQCEVCYDTVKTCGMLSNTMFTAYESACRKLLNIDPKIVVCASTIDSTAKVDGIADIVEKATLCVCSITYSSASKTMIDYMHSHGCKCKPWTVNSAATINTLIGNGADYVITDSVKPSQI